MELEWIIDSHLSRCFTHLEASVFRPLFGEVFFIEFQRIDVDESNWGAMNVCKWFDAWIGFLGTHNSHEYMKEKWFHISYFERLGIEIINRKPIFFMFSFWTVEWADAARRIHRRWQFAEQRFGGSQPVPRLSGPELDASPTHFHGRSLVRSIFKKIDGKLNYISEVAVDWETLQQCMHLHFMSFNKNLRK